MTNTLYVADALHTRYPVSQEEAQALYPALEKAIVGKRKLTLSFRDIENCASLFINGLFGKLYDNYAGEVDSYIRITDVVSDENAIIDRIERTKKRALSQFHSLS